MGCVSFDALTVHCSALLLCARALSAGWPRFSPPGRGWLTTLAGPAMQAGADHIHQSVKQRSELIIGIISVLCVAAPDAVPQCA